MVFSEPTFLFFFLPVIIGFYFLSPVRFRNYFLLAASLFFYSWGEELYVLVLIASISQNYVFGILINYFRNSKLSLWFLLAGVFSNLAWLGYFKYFNFVMENVPSGFIEIGNIHLPIGISFFTFQALTYLIDLYARRIEVQKDPFKLALYISLFPQLIAGPIVRYAEVERALTTRRTTRGDFASGFFRFVLGLAKKTLIADNLGLLADQIFDIPNEGLSGSVAWLGVICYSLQIYFDFSAYSDMAIGLGRIFGFKFPENFNYPYIAQSVTDFWRRWHMTLSRWFRDYLYIPLGGNRNGTARTYVNLFVVFLLCGFWHGASWNFILWGGYYGFFLMVERMGLGKFIPRLPRVFRHSYLLLVVMIGWVPFRAETFEQSISFLKSMFLLQAGELATLYPLDRFLSLYGVIVIIAGIVFATPIGRLIFRENDGQNSNGLMSIQQGPEGQDIPRKRWMFISLAKPAAIEVIFWLLLSASIISVGSASYSPFIYFRF